MNLEFKGRVVASVKYIWQIQHIETKGLLSVANNFTVLLWELTVKGIVPDLLNA